MIADRLTEILRCSACGARYDAAGDALVCRKCNARFPVVDGIAVLTHQNTVATALENIDYDAVHGVTPEFIHNTGAQWKDLIDHLGGGNEDVLDVGAGTGVLTLGLLEQKAVGRLVATDVSYEFLRALARRVSAFDTPVSFVACDANEPHFRASSFDLIVGRSILHHLLDYDETLRRCQAMLKPGGAAVFFEPVLEGKTIVTMLMAMMLRCDARAASPVFSQTDRERIGRQILHQTKSKRRRHTRERLARLEDKYIFEIDRMKAVGTEAGFDDVEFVNNGAGDPTYWPYVVQTCQSVDVAPDKVRSYRWLGEQFADTYGLMLPENLVTPMGFFVFRKTRHPKRRTRRAAHPEIGERPIRKRARSWLATEIVVGLARAGVSVKGACDLHMIDERDGVRHRSIVYVVTIGGDRYLVASNGKARWPRTFREGRAGELRIGRHREQIRATEVRDFRSNEVVRAWYKQLAPFRLVATGAARSYAELSHVTIDHRVFRIERV